MRHLIVCREYPPAPGGGIGTYVLHLSRLLAESGETVHVIGQLWKGAEKEVEEQCDGRLVVHRLPVEDWASLRGPKPHPAIASHEAKGLFKSGYHPQCFSWQASLLAEELVDVEGIDIIEAQEYEAPLYYFQLRRGLGFGPKRHPPCLVHLHSPTEFIARYNDWEMNQPAVLVAKRLEDYCIAAADALVCPSQYLAHQAEAHYGMAEGTVHVIPYPIGASRMIERDDDTWERGTICYVGRLEPRKGVMEWVDAAVALAREHPTAQFEFVGADTLQSEGTSVQDLMEFRIPRDLNHRFRFRGEQRRSSLPRFLARARMAVVPSRWENFPNTCMEAICSGLPIIASRRGGMAEMVRDGETGWLANAEGSDGLAEALERALKTAPKRVEEMGHQASSDIRRMCDAKRIVDRHLDLRGRIASRGAEGSLRLPVNLPWAGRPLSEAPPRRVARADSPAGLAFVVVCSDTGHSLERCLQSLDGQTRRPAEVVVVDAGAMDARDALDRARQDGRRVIHRREAGLATAKNAGVEGVLSSGSDPIGFAFLAAEDEVRPRFAAVCESVLRRCPDVGLVSCWCHDSDAQGGMWTRPCPSFPYQWLVNDAPSFTVVRTEALREVGGFRPLMNRGYEDWDLFNAVMAAGWVAVSVPEVLVRRSLGRYRGPRLARPVGAGEMRRELLERFPDLVARDAKALVLLVGPFAPRSLSEASCLLRRQLGVIGRAIRRPRRTARAVLAVAKARLTRRRRA